MDVQFLWYLNDTMKSTFDFAKILHLFLPSGMSMNSFASPQPF